MNRPVTLTLTGDQHARLYRHLYPGDGLEAVAVLVCGHRDGELRHRLLVREVFEVPYALCKRTAVSVKWQPCYLDDLLNRAEREQLSLIKVHSHPGGSAHFSPLDDESDAALLPAIRGWVEADVLHGSAVMLPSGEMFARTFDGQALNEVTFVNVIGDNLLFWYPGGGSTEVPSFAASHAQIFDEGTIERLQRLVVAVIGCSGTGSPLIEQLVRLGVGVIILVDDDFMEVRNVNRILNSTMKAVRRKRYKVDVIGDAIEAVGLGTTVIRVKKNLWNADVVRQVAECDVVFGCMDTVDGRYLLNALSTYYLQGYFDVGVRLDAVPDGADKGRVREVCGTIHYIQPDKSSLMSRDLFSMDQVAAAGLKRTDPAAHDQQVKDGYIRGVASNRPAVISVNMYAASLAVNEFLARLHPYREEPNVAHAQVTFSLASMELMSEPEGELQRCRILGRHVGKGDVRPLLGTMELAEIRA